MQIFKPFILIIFMSYAQLSKAVGHFSFGALKNFQSYQNAKAEKERDPFLPVIKIGHTFAPLSVFYFSPQVFYAFGSKESDDSYGGDYSVKTYGILYDFIYPLYSMTKDQGLFLRYGIGNVIKSITGEGGTVEVPNGSGTATAYRPGETSRSYTATFNIGLDLTLPWSFFSGTIKGAGARFEYLITSPLKSSKRSGILMLSFQGYL